MTQKLEPSASAEIPQDQIERLSGRVMGIVKVIAANGNGRTVTADAIYAAMPETNRQRIKDAIKTLKDARRLHAIGGGRGIYEIEESFPPPRSVSVSTLTDGWRLLEVGDAIAIALTPAEAAIFGNCLAGDAVRLAMVERLMTIESTLRQVQHENGMLKQKLQSVAKARNGG